MTEVLDRLTVALANGQGEYALLLGSGLSMAAGMPTGWDVVVSLARQLAAAHGAPNVPDPVRWYQRQYGRTAGYSRLIEEVAPEPAERARLLGQFFERSVADRHIGCKMPTPAHKAIARLVKLGLVRVILTRNFDKLIEEALTDIGITPHVIKHPSDTEGVRSLERTPCTVVKLHGDFTDVRMLNTAGELASYDPRLKRLLGDVLTRYGLIVCGWSAEWDPALRRALRSGSHPYSTYWFARRGLTEKASHLAAQRGAQIVTGLDADTLFCTLVNGVENVLATTDEGRQRLRTLDEDGVLVTIRHMSRHWIPARAVAACLPPELAGYTIEEITIDQTDLFQESRLADPLAAARRQIDLDQRLNALLAVHPGAAVAYYGIAHIPLLFLAGQTLFNKQRIRFFDYDRRQETWDLLQREGPAPALTITGLPEHPDQTAGEVVVQVSISFRVSRAAVRVVVPTALATIELAVDHPRIDLLTSEQQVRDYGAAFGMVLNRIHDVLPNATRVHVFYAGPPPVAFQCGRQIVKNIHPRVIVYNYHAEDDPQYSWGLDLMAPIEAPEFLVRPGRSQE